MELNVANGEKYIFSRSSSSSRIVLAIAFPLFRDRRESESFMFAINRPALKTLNNTD